MPDKTLKESTFAKASVDEKVERARQYLGNKGFHPHLDAVCLSITEVGVIKEALTALEEKVAELEKERRKLWSTINELMDGKEAPDGK